MSNIDNDDKNYSFGQILLATFVGVIGITLFIILVAKIFGVTDTIEVAEPTAALAKVEANVKPVADVDVASADAGAKTEKSGEEVVKGICAMCHDAGLMNAPKIGDKGQWQPRIAQGYETLVKHAIEGIRTMPARGGNPALTDSEVASAVAHMANLSGANFTVSAPKAAESEPVDAKPVAAEAMPAPVTVAADKPAQAVAQKVKTSAPEAKPVAPVAAAAGKSGEEVYKSACIMCHAAGLMNAPKFGDKAQWEARIKQGHDTLVHNAIKGIRMMPARGGNPALSDAEVTAAVNYMANAAGANF